MTASSLLPLAAEKAGMNFGQLIDRLIELGLEEH
jgi:D-alanine-D-alanine ligase-like ATP-grasp enzyme